MKSRLQLTNLLLAVHLLALAGCATKTPPPPSGFISNYSELRQVDKRRAQYVSPALGNYQAYMVDPVQIMYTRERKPLKPSERAEVAQYLRSAYIRVLRANGYPITDQPGLGVARLRIAITDMKKAELLLNLYWATKLSGVGTGGASMELEVIDSITGQQVAAAVFAGRGSQFELDTFDTLDDVRDVIDRWAAIAEEELRKAIAGRAATSATSTQQL